MKKPVCRTATLFLALVAFSLQSCLKEYTCKCPSNGILVATGTMKAATKYEAERACRALGGDECIAEK